MSHFKVIETPLCFVIDEGSVFNHIVILRGDQSVHVYTFPVGCSDYKKYRNFTSWDAFAKEMPQTAEAILEPTR
jgi:hypothetical protein